MKRIYWDTAAGTSIDKRVLKAMMPYLMDNFGNPASIHQEGVATNEAVEKVRAKIAKILFAHPDEVIFTGSGTESDNLAILGTAELRSPTSGSLEVGLQKEKKEVGFRIPKPSHIITTSMEHKAVLEPCRYLQKKGFKVAYLKVDKTGQINLTELKESLTKDTFLVSIMKLGQFNQLKKWQKLSGVLEKKIILACLIYILTLAKRPDF